MKLSLLMLIVLLLLGIQSCAPTRQYVSLDNDQLTEPARIYVIRDSFLARSFTTKVYANDKLVGKLGNNSYLTWETDKPTIDVEAKLVNTAKTELNLEAGKTYYLKNKVKLGAITSRVKLELLSSEEGLKVLSGVKGPRLDLAQN